MDGLADEYGLVDSSINDITPEPTPFDPKGAPKNYCERQGRCNVGCLPGARHTLNKQLLPAVLRGPLDPQKTPLFPNIELKNLAEGDVIRAVAEGGDQGQYFQSDPEETCPQTG